jgi:copper transport protein
VRRGLFTVLAVAAIIDADLFAHAALRFSNPMEGATLGDTPSTVQLTFGERPEAALSEIHVADMNGVAYEIGRPTLVAGDPLSLTIAVRPLGTGVYTVNYRVVSAVDGHATAGAYVFGVRASPSAVAARNASATISKLEVVARWILVCGLIVLLGAASASIARFGGAGDLSLAGAGWLLSALGLVLFAEAQKRNTSASLSQLFATAIGRALVWRTVFLGAAAVSLASAYWTARSSQLRARSVAMTAAAIAALSVMAVHVAAGHAGAGPIANVTTQWAHVAASGVWIGGLAALLLGVRGAPSEIKASSIRRFSTIAGVGIAVVGATGAWRAVNELGSWDDLIATVYGRIVLLKVALFSLIALLGAINRWRNVPRARLDLRPLRTAAGGELVLAAGALVAAAWLGTLPPPASRAIPGIRASGVDFGTTVRVSLSAASDQPGPNRFVVRIVDYDSKKPVPAARVTLRFTPIDDPRLPATALPLAPGPDDTYVGSGANLSFDGRWRITALIEHDRDSREVPMNIEVRSRSH